MITFSNQERDLVRDKEIIPTGFRKITGGLWVLSKHWGNGALDFNKMP
jgi:hypothetical protein